MSSTNKFVCKKCAKVNVDQITKDYQAITIFGSIAAMKTAIDKVCGCNLEKYWFRGAETVSERIDYAIMNMDYDLVDQECEISSSDEFLQMKSITNLLNKKSKHQKAVQKRLQKQYGQTTKQGRWKIGTMKNKILVSEGL